MKTEQFGISQSTTTVVLHKSWIYTLIKTHPVTALSDRARWLWFYSKPNVHIGAEMGFEIPWKQSASNNHYFHGINSICSLHSYIPIVTSQNNIWVRSALARGLTCLGCAAASAAPHIGRMFPMRGISQSQLSVDERGSREHEGSPPQRTELAPGTAEVGTTTWTQHQSIRTA